MWQYIAFKTSISIVIGEALCHHIAITVRLHCILCDWGRAHPELLFTVLKSHKSGFNISMNLVQNSSSSVIKIIQLSRNISIYKNSPIYKERIMHFIDIAANLTDNMYKGEYNGSIRHTPDISVVLSRAQNVGCVRMLVTAGTLSQSREARTLCKDEPSLFSTVGVHPTRAGEMLPDPQNYVDRLFEVIEEGKDKVVAVGECGLDYDRTQFCSERDQLPGFLAQFDLAERSGLPMFLHDRNTRGDFGRIIRENRSRFSAGVVHSFTGTMEEMQQYVNMDLYIGINGCSLKTKGNLEVAAAVPSDRIMLETDCPYCEIRSTHAGYQFVKTKWPSKDKKKYSVEATVKGRNEPCQIRQVCEVLAAVRGVSEDELARSAFNNTMRVFFPKESEHMGTSPYDWSVNAVSRI